MDKKIEQKKRDSLEDVAKKLMKDYNIEEIDQLFKNIEKEYTTEEQNQIGIIYESYMKKQKQELEKKRLSYPLETQDQPFCPIIKKTCSHYCKAHYFTLDDVLKLKQNKCRIFKLIDNLENFDISELSYLDDINDTLIKINDTLENSDIDNTLTRIGLVLDKKHQYFPDREGKYFP